MRSEMLGNLVPNVKDAKIQSDAMMLNNINIVWYSKLMTQMSQECKPM